MTNPVFPSLVLKNGGLDSQQYSVTLEDPSISTKIEGGYVVSRAKHTRAPRRTFAIVYKAISDADKAAISAFYDSVRGGSTIFDWADPSSGAILQVRFQGELTLSYVGMGKTKLWNLSFKVQTA